MYVIRRIPDGKYVNQPGSKSSYTRSLERARKYPTYAAAQADCCVENERVIDVRELL